MRGRNILIFENNPIFSSGLKFFISSNSNYNIVGIHNQLETVIDLLISEEIHILLVDLDSNERSGFELIKKVNKQYPKLHLIGLTFIYNWKDFEGTETVNHLSAIINKSEIYVSLLKTLDHLYNPVKII